MRSINEVFIVIAWQSNLNVNVTIAYLAVTHDLNGFFLFAGEVGTVLNLAGNLLDNVVELGSWQRHVELDVVAIFVRGWCYAFS